jgi:uncharacterized protein YehS (DUF1456 family)
MMQIFKLADKEISRAQISDWLKKDDDPAQRSLYDIDLASFLNGMIILNRGKKDGPPMKAEKTLNNNLILRKLKIALSFKDEDILDILQLADFRLSKHELSAFFRKPGQSQYRTCKDQVLRNFIQGLQIKIRKED